MKFSKVYTAQTFALTTRIIDVEIDLSRGLHAFSIIGLGDRAVGEAKDRFSAAIKNSGFTSPKQKNQKVVVSLAPADIPKAGPHFDLAIALGYLLAAGDIHFDPRKRLFVGELSLDGTLRKIESVLPIAHEAMLKGFTELFVPKENVAEATLVKDISVFGASHIKEVIQHLTKEHLLKKGVPRPVDDLDWLGSSLDDVDGNETAKRALEIAAAGKHNIVLIGPPGTGKTLLASGFPSILPWLTLEELVSVRTTHASLKETWDGSWRVPFRRPHHTSSYSAMIGGGNKIQPGEITLAHKGVLFMDEFAEFDRRVIESLREPLEERRVTVSRASGRTVFPSDFILVAAMNPCPCGYYGSGKKLCSCTTNTLKSYSAKMSGPVSERIDLWVNVSEETQKSTDEVLTTVRMRERIIKARALQQKRFSQINTIERGNVETNSGMPPRLLKKLVVLGASESKIISDAKQSLGLSKRAVHRVIKVSQTIADLAGEEKIRAVHVLEALQYRGEAYWNGL